MSGVFMGGVVPDLELPDPEPARPPRREPPMAWMVGASIAIHLGVVGFLLWPALRTTLEALPPEVIEVELVTLSEEPNSEPPSSSVAEAASSEPPTSEEPTSEEPSSVEPPVSQAEPSQAPSETPSEAPRAAAEPPPSEPATATPPAPIPMARPITVTVGSGEEPSAEPISAEESGVTELTAETGDVAAGDAITESADSAPAMGELNVAQNFYLAEILGSASMANAREALESLPPDKRLAQTCNIEAVGQVGSMGRGFAPDAVIAEAFSAAVISDTRLVADGAIFRSAEKWYALAFDCTLSDDLTAVTTFTFRLGPDVTAIVARAQQTGG